MKKGILLLLLLCMIAVLPLSATAAANTAVEASQSVINPGQKVTFTVSVKDAQDIRSMAVMPIYDAESFELLEGSWLTAGILANFDTEKGLGVIAWFGAVDVNTQVFQFVLQAKETAEAGQKEIGSTVVLMDSKGQRTEQTAACAQVALAGQEDVQGTTQEATEPTVEHTQPTRPEKGDAPETTQKPTESTADDESALRIEAAVAAITGGIAASLRLN